MMRVRRIEQAPSFARALKKLHQNQQRDIQIAIAALAENPMLGNTKMGDLRDVRVYKFRMVKQLALIAYYYHEEQLILHLLKFGSHENFYDDLKNTLQ